MKLCKNLNGSKFFLRIHLRCIENETILGYNEFDCECVLTSDLEELTV